MYQAENMAEGEMGDPLVAIDGAVSRAVDALAAQQRSDGHWVFELEADATIPAEYLLLRHYLGEPEDLELEARIGRYLRRIQGEDGGWPLFHAGAADISATVKAYFALKLIGDDIDAPHMARARELVLAAGGAGASNVFTRIQLALYGAGPWEAVPEVPVELILLPRWFPIHLSKMSYWARTVIVPLLVLTALRPVARNPRGTHVNELYGDRGLLPLVSRAADRKWQWVKAFDALDRILKLVRPYWPKRLRKRAMDRCVAWVTERLNGEDGLGAIYPAMANSVMMFDVLGFPPDHPHRAIARKSVENLLVLTPEDNPDEVYCQPCVSPVWDTALAAHAMLEAGGEAAEQRAAAALTWLARRQILEVAGDWAEERPNVRPGGWAFQYGNDHYPDLDDTAVVVMAMDRAQHRLGLSGVYDQAIERGVEWTVGMQSRNGGWGAFDADNSHHYLNNIPLADHGALLDPPTVDVSARCVSMLAQLGEKADSPHMKAALAYLEKEQEPDGSWFGRWGVNYIYGTWSALCALAIAGVDPEAPVMRRAVGWLERIQNEDGGWGEDCDSYALDYAGHRPAPSTASQTAWALIGLMAAGEVESPAVARGVAWLLANQRADGLWPQDHYTGGGFPRVFYLRYHGYPKFFPLWAIARYRNLKRGNTRRVAFGM
jgi:squalene-hopene/tetraprenyl-beta-curcumene cyclase